MKELAREMLEIVGLVWTVSTMAAGLYSMWNAVSADTFRDAVMWFGVAGGFGALTDRELMSARKRREAREAE